MHTDPLVEWQRLTQLYREMGDGELEALDADKADLTQVAQQVLSDEVRKRGLDKLSEPDAKRSDSPTWSSHVDVTAGGEADAEDDQAVEYTWKTFLCERENPEETWQIQEVLRRAGIESWLENPGYYVAPGASNPRIMVAADQLEKAGAILAMPIPQEIVEQSKIGVPEYVPPVCPSCGAEEPILESADPVNAWRCEQCGKEWTEQAEDVNER